MKRKNRLAQFTCWAGLWAFFEIQNIIGTFHECNLYYLLVCMVVPGCRFQAKLLKDNLQMAVDVAKIHCDVLAFKFSNTSICHKCTPYVTKGHLMSLGNRFLFWGQELSPKGFWYFLVEQKLGILTHIWDFDGSQCLICANFDPKKNMKQHTHLQTYTVVTFL